VSEEAHQGGCRCGGVRFAVHGAPILTFACHCTGCQRMTGSAYSLSSLYPAERFEVLEGDTVLGGLKGPSKQHFCPSCMSWLFTVPEGFDAFVNIRSPMLDDVAGHRPFVDMWRSEGPEWGESGAERRFDKIPEEHEFAELTAAYGEWSGRVTQ
jgi:hypothetical protein